MANIITTPLEGIDFTQTYIGYNAAAATSATNSPDYPGLPFVAGSRASATNGAEYMFVTASSAITANQCVAVSETDATAAPVTKALADGGSIIGVAPVAIASGSSGWVLVNGAASITLKNACLPSVPLYTSATAGALDDTSASQTRVYGIRSKATATSSLAAKVCWISNPTV